MENSSDRFFKGFSLEHYRLQVIVNSLEKEKKQCLNRLKGETHVFKMSARLPLKREEGYWNQYGEIFHANGDRREKASVTHLSAEHNKEDLKSNNTAHHDNTNNLKYRSKIIPSDSPQHAGSVNRNVQKNSIQWIRGTSNRKHDSSRKPKEPDLTLLEILCGDFENGVMPLKKDNKKNDSSFGNTSNYLGHQRNKQSKKARKKGQREKLLSSDVYKSLESDGKEESITGSQSSNRLEIAQSEAGDISSRSKSVSFEAVNSDDTLKTSSISLGLRSQESIPLRNGSAQKLNWNFSDSVNSFGLSEVEKSLQSPESQSHEWNSPKQAYGKKEYLAAENAEHSTSSNKNEESISSNHACSTRGLEAQAWEHHCRFVHFKEGYKMTKKRGNKQNSGVDMNEKEKLYRSKSPHVKLFQVDVPQTYQRRKSQEEIDKETRQKMDEFFAKVERTKNFQRPGKLRWRCCSGSEIGTRRNEWKSSLELAKRPHTVKNHGYCRAQPWPTQVWS